MKMLIEIFLTNTSMHLRKVYWKKSLKRFFYAFEKSLFKVFRDFINNINDDYERNLWTDSSMILLENLINAHLRNL